MFAKIMDGDMVYYSPVFAVSMKRHKFKAIVFDHSFTQLIVVDVFHSNTYNIFFMDFDDTGFSIIKDHFKSYWDDKHIFATVKRKKYTPAMLEEAKGVLSKQQKQEYTIIKTQGDLVALDINSGAFHDGYVLEMRQENQVLEILLDTSWGAFILLRCKEIVKNTLPLGGMFYGCDMHIEHGYVKFSFDPTWGTEEKVLVAKHVEFKPIFERRIPIKDFAYRFLDHTLSIKTGSKWIEIDNSSIHMLDFGKRKVLGYLENDDIMQSCLIFSNDIVYSFRKYAINRKPQSKWADMVLTFQNICKEQGFYFEQYPLFDGDLE